MTDYLELSRIQREALWSVRTRMIADQAGEAFNDLFEPGGRPLLTSIVPHGLPEVLLRAPLRPSSLRKN